jgi:adenine-specific DNA-methyltransferase
MMNLVIVDADRSIRPRLTTGAQETDSGTSMTAQGRRPNQMYRIVTPTGVEHYPPIGRCWSMV